MECPGFRKLRAWGFRAEGLEGWESGDKGFWCLRLWSLGI